MVPHPVPLRGEMERHGFAVQKAADGFEIALGADRLSVRCGPSDGPLEVRPCEAPAAPGDGGSSTARLAAIGLATVDHERFARDHAIDSLETGPHDDLLGAWSWRSDGLERLVLLEPSTEGRLAGALARAGEGPLVVYLSADEVVRPAGGSPTALGIPGVLVRVPDRLPAIAIIVV